MRDSRPILLVEDDKVDAVTVERALKSLKVTNLLVHCSDGEAALEYLRDESRKKPFLILLDLNMPKLDGVEFLGVVKSEEGIREIPVIVFSMSRDGQDIIECFKLGAAGFMVKSIDYKDFTEVMRTVNLYWSTSELPKAR